ncbi:MAG: acyl-CoA dehydratase activase-related protein [Butyricicoccaceae bacterium]
MMPYFELADPKRFRKHAVSYFCKKYPQLKKKAGARRQPMPPIRRSRNTAPPSVMEGQKAIRYADEHGLDVAVIAGRPYHVDPEINHGIDQLISSFGLVIVSEDAVWQLTDAPEVHVLNQWTYHSRMYGAAKYVTQKENAQLIQLVSFGCGIDAITTDEMRAICENGGKIYTQLKIDEISNLGAAKIRIRSMLAAVEEGRKLAEQQRLANL